jgi:hypothetical protein
MAALIQKAATFTKAALIVLTKTTRRTAFSRRFCRRYASRTNLGEPVISKCVPAFAILVLVGCAGVNPEGLRPVSGAAPIVLRAPIQYDEYYRIAGNRFHYTIAPGAYPAKYEDTQGIYHEGPGLCFTIRIESDSIAKEGKTQPTPHSYRCGIYLPRSASAEPKLYFYRDPEVSRQVFSGSASLAPTAPGGVPRTPTEGVGGAIGMGVVQALDAAELKNLHFYQDQPKPGQIRSALR